MPWEDADSRRKGLRSLNHWTVTWGTKKPCPGLNLWDHGVAVTVLSPFWIENLLLQLSVLTWGLCIVASLLPRLGSGGWLLGTQAHHLSHIGLCGWPASCTDLPHCFGPACWAGPSEYHCLAVASVFPGLNSIHSCTASLRRSALYLQVSFFSLMPAPSLGSFPGSIPHPRRSDTSLEMRPNVSQSTDLPSFWLTYSLKFFVNHEPTLHVIKLTSKISHHKYVVPCCAMSLQLCPTLCSPMHYSPQGSSVHGILQARILEWVAIPSFKGSSCPRDWTCIS